MSSAALGGLAGGMASVGALVVLRVLTLTRRIDPGTRIWPYLRDLPGVAQRLAVDPHSPSPPMARVMRWAADRVDAVVGGAPSVRRRLARSGSDQTVHDFRIEQVAWGLTSFTTMALLSIVRASSGDGTVLGSALLCLTAFAFGVLLRDNRLTARVRKRERRVLEELPAISELLALSLAAGEGPAAALDRVVRRSTGALSADLAGVLAEVRTGMPVAQAFDDLASATGVPEVRRFAESIATAVERGTPLADVLHAQAGDVREARRRELIETGARKEVAMMVPVVFLVLPATVLVAFWPGVVGLMLLCLVKPRRRGLLEVVFCCWSQRLWAVGSGRPVGRGIASGSA
ncbi:type II secretion system F family protein [Nocardioides alcanivorans]|uniref:type II secretion system F family protein n=1 Tax=Nocardioides alcanivorans TaxID=2897352 RepID=UPI001F23F2FF|nr:type II secretion system F family protein [Nocardioides alcanivorans]